MEGQLQVSWWFCTHPSKVLPHRELSAMIHCSAYYSLRYHYPRSNRLNILDQIDNGQSILSDGIISKVIISYSKFRKIVGGHGR